jgi:hypothetical protein
MGKSTLCAPDPALGTSIRHDAGGKTAGGRTEVFKEVHVDTMGPFQVPSLTGSLYAVHLTELSTKFRWIYFVKKKDTIVDKIIDFHEKVLALGYRLGTLKSDNGTEFVNDKLNAYAKSRFLLRTTPPYCPRAMGISERLNRVLLEKTRSMLKDRKLSKNLWEEAMKVIVYVENRIIHKEMRKTTPYEMLFGMRPNVSNLRIFGCKAYPFVFDPRKKKLDDNTYEGLFICYDDGSAAYRVYIPSQRKFIKSLYVIFNEEAVLENVNPFNAEERNNYFTDYELLQNEAGDGTTVIPPYLSEIPSTSYPLSPHQISLPYSPSSTPTYSSSASPLDPSLFHQAEISSSSSLETSS